MMIFFISDDEDMQPRRDSYADFLEYGAKQPPGIDCAPLTKQKLEEVIYNHARAICVQVKYICN